MCEGSNDNRINRPIKELSNIIRFLLYSPYLPHPPGFSLMMVTAGYNQENTSANNFLIFYYLFLITPKKVPLRYPIGATLSIKI